MRPPANGFLEAIDRMERQRRLLLGPGIELREALNRSNPLAQIMESAERTRRMLDGAVGPGIRLGKIMADAERSQLVVKAALGDLPGSFTRLAETISRSTSHLNLTFGPAANMYLAAISRSFILSPQLFAASAAVIEVIEAEPPGGSVQGTAWASSLDELFDALDNSADAAEGKIDRRALLRFIRWLLPVLIAAAYSTWLALASSERTQDGLERVESAIEDHGSEAGQAHDDIEDTLTEAVGRISALSDRVEGQLEEEGDGEFYLVVRPVPITEERRYNGARITWLLPGQEVEVIERSKKWLRVIAYDFESKETHEGWVLKKYLKRLGR